jgi:MFS family permease
MMKGVARKSLKVSLGDGICWGVMAGLAESYIVPFALALGAGAMQIAFIRSAPVLLSSLGQLGVERMVAFFGGRRSLLLRLVSLQAAALVLAAFSAMLPGHCGIYFFMALVIVYTVAGNVSTPPWSSLMCEYLPPSRRGVYLGWRDSMQGFVYSAVGFSSGWIMALFKGRDLWGFLLIFMLAGSARFLSVHYISLMYESRRQAASAISEDGESFLSFIMNLRKDNVALFTFACSFLLFGVYLAAPFFSVYMLEGLKFSYWQYLSVTTASAISGYMFTKRWGDVTDKYGSVAVMRAAVCLIPLAALFWSFTTDWRLLAVNEACSGIIWASYGRATSNFIYDSMPAALRTRYLSYFALATGVAQFAGTLCGGWLYGHMPVVWGHRFVSVLFLTTGLRLLAAVPFLFMIKQVKQSASVHKVLTKMFVPGWLYSE